ncbi:hypothetical protein Bbelb_049020 [Branchiostoma belcheri]|nr:hypothetical protein Bbelb_049020 [Branchiostoma belcheri]
MSKLNQPPLSPRHSPRSLGFQEAGQLRRKTALNVSSLKKVADVKNELDKRDLYSNGNMKQLEERLQRHLNVVAPTNRSGNTRETDLDKLTGGANSTNGRPYTTRRGKTTRQNKASFLYRNLSTSTYEVVIGDQTTCKNIRGARRFRQDDVDDLEKLTWAKECKKLNQMDEFVHHACEGPLIAALLQHQEMESPTEGVEERTEDRKTPMELLEQINNSEVGPREELDVVESLVSEKRMKDQIHYQVLTPVHKPIIDVAQVTNASVKDALSLDLPGPVIEVEESDTYYIPDGKADTIVEKLKEFLKVGEATIRMLRVSILSNYIPPILAQAHNTNVREYKDDTRKIVSSSLLRASSSTAHSTPHTLSNAARWRTTSENAARLIGNRGRRRNQRAVIERRQRQRRLLYLCLAVAQVMHAATIVDRAIWERNRSKNWWDETVVGTFTDADWQENFRVSRLTFDYLCDQLRARLQRRRKMKWRIPVPVEKRVAVALWYFATGCGYRTLGHLFGVANCEFVYEATSRKDLMPRRTKLIEWRRSETNSLILYVGMPSEDWDPDQSTADLPQCLNQLDNIKIDNIQIDKETYHSRFPTEVEVRDDVELSRKVSNIIWSEIPWSLGLGDPGQAFQVKECTGHYITKEPIDKQDLQRLEVWEKSWDESSDSEIESGNLKSNENGDYRANQSTEPKRESHFSCDLPKSSRFTTCQCQPSVQLRTPDDLPVPAQCTAENPRRPASTTCQCQPSVQLRTPDDLPVPAQCTAEDSRLTVDNNAEDDSGRIHSKANKLGGSAAGVRTASRQQAVARRTVVGLD